MASERRSALPGGSVHLLLLLLCNSCLPTFGVFECDFDDPGICGFTQSTDDDINFLHHSGRTPTEVTGPVGDHTSGSGHYMYMEASDVVYGSTARLISPRFNATDVDGDDEVNGIQITFWVHMNGEEMGSLRLLVMDAITGNATSTPEPMTQILMVGGEQGTEWVQKNVTLSSSQDFHIVFEAICGASSAGDIAIDDVTVNDDVIIVATEPPVITLQELNCTFEEPGLCGFTQAVDDNFNLIRQRADTNQNPFAQQKDHTFGNNTGTYLSADIYTKHVQRWWWSWSYFVRQTSNGQRAGQTARLISPMFSGVGEDEEPACLLFWYHMHGKSVGQLQVYVKNETSDALENPVWYLSGERGQVWRAAEVRIVQPLNFQIVFQFIAGSEENLAIDDVSLSRYECPGEHPIASVPSVDCDFGEAELCYYTQDDSDEFDWIWTNRATDSHFTGPAQDHTRGDELGFYVHIDSENQRAGSISRLMSPVIDPQDSPSCLVFWFHMYGSHVGRLSVYAKHNDSALPATPIWTLSGNQGNNWHQSSTVITSMTRQFVLVFEGVLGIDYRTDIAIDDVKFYPGSQCPEYPTSAPPPTTLPPAQTDFSCSFESDNCNFTQATDDIMDWTRVRASFLQQTLNPYWYGRRHRTHYGYRWKLRGAEVDHTLNTPDGSYLVFWYRYNHILRRNDRSRTLTPLIAGSANPRCLTFFMYKDGYNEFLNIYIKEYGETRSIDPVFAYYWSTGKRWWRMSVNIQPSERPFNIIFEAVIPSGRWYMVHSVDDVTLVDGECAKKTEADASCDFEDNNICGYRAGQWSRNRGETPSKHTGPSADHTLGNASGYYMYYETSQPNRPGSYSDMISTLMHFVGKQCLRFYYHASGNDTRKMKVFLYENTQFTSTNILTIEGKQKDAWLPFNVDIDVSGDFQIIFRAFTGRGYKGDVAVDDVIILSHPCVSLPTKISCNFELGPESCGFEKSPQNAMAWKWYDAIFGKNYPFTKRSTATNSFMYLTSPSSSSSSSKSQVTELYSKHLTVSPTAGDLCLSIEYIFQGNSTQPMTIDVEEKGGARRQLGSVTAKGISEWSMMTWSLLSSHMLRPFIVYRIVFSISALPDQTVVGIDNVIVSAETCKSLEVEVGSPPQAEAHSSGSTRPGKAVGIGIFVVVLFIAIGIAAFFYRARVRALFHRCTQRVTEMNYKRHDVAFVNDDKKETVEIPSIVSHDPGQETSASSSVSVENSQNNK